MRSSVDRLREQVALHPGASGNGTNSSSPLLATDDVRAALAAERMAREQGDERCLEEMRDMVREERQKREKDCKRQGWQNGNDQCPQVFSIFELVTSRWRMRMVEQESCSLVHAVQLDIFSQLSARNMALWS